ncbi:uncharacterized protein PHALS_06237 [Plasmopara halstedii]|uniref:RxLR-like protein n=1 Tax=Plasmopara halstedii TaxID=4781 RepID=A0A0P1B103_PLAHL|nr:uncharacterized protein PHALS_06237 [Plasmopara halstedii]CEG48413.1 hypothetical protein PHALS_06237 [Plasmopara halstedii]|eukprot:XP_024584782.1 hypothetical protein PHALS_06237 [Plasmopara halstedii]
MTSLHHVVITVLRPLKLLAAEALSPYTSLDAGLPLTHGPPSVLEKCALVLKADKTTAGHQIQLRTR